MIAECKSQDEFNKKFENTLKKNGFSWKIIKDVIIKYPDFYDEYAKTYDYKLHIRKKSMCDGCKHNDGNFHVECYHCGDD